MTHYTLLTQEQRYQIQAYMKAGFDQSQPADFIDFDKSTISRELRRILLCASFCLLGRCLNENTNGLIRQHFLKNHDFTTIHQTTNRARVEN